MKTIVKQRMKSIFIGVAILIVAILIGLVIWNRKGANVETRGLSVEEVVPTLAIETPQKVSISQTDELILDVTIEKLGEELYPAASFSISFDASRLEFLGVQEGNVFVHNNAVDSQMTQKLPEWSCNVEQSNKTGMINIMYLDLTGGKNAFSQELLAEEDNVVLRLLFRVRGSVRVGDICDLIVEDAVFAASDETKSLSVIQNTLKIKNGKIVMGE